MFWRRKKIENNQLDHLWTRIGYLESRIASISQNGEKMLASFSKIADSLDLRGEIERLDDQYNSAYARTAERRLESLEAQNKRYCEREKELLERWKDHVADLQRQVKRLESENEELRNELAYLPPSDPSAENCCNGE